MTLKKHLFPLLLLLIVFIAPSALLAKVRLPKIFTDNMVLQRDQPVKVWGWADKGEGVSVTFNGQEVKTKADARGQWQVMLQPMVYGGPYEMTVRDKTGNHVLRNVLIGDVWICSGQSNMEMPVCGWSGDSIRDARKEIKAARYPNIRLFTVEKAMSYTPLDDLSGGSWQECTPGNMAAFSAVAYFFGKKLNEELAVPVGLINTSWGGTNIQTWTSWGTMTQQDAYKNINLKDLSTLRETWQKNRERYNTALANDPGVKEKWYDPATATSGWKKITMPDVIENTELGNADGIVWFRKDIELGSTLAGKPATINFGAIDDNDETYINGTLVGKTNNYAANRNYAIGAGVLKAGKNSIVVKITDTGGSGGFSGTAKDLYLTIGSEQISLAGEWMFKGAVVSTQYEVRDTGPNAFPSQLYNAMVAPLIPYAIKGATWYQGESNADEPDVYRTLFPAMINDWRNKWHNDFPFMWVQLANFMQPVANPARSNWAALREAQHQTLAVSHTGEAVAIDIGEANDIHPKNKQDVGYRLALAALKVAYGKDMVYSGPVFQAMKVNGNAVSLEFTNEGSGLAANGDKYGYLRGFAIAGSDQRFVWAKAYIEGDKVIVFSDQVKDPVAVRYAWGNNPDDANLYNKEGLPASPFRTDTWK